MSFYNMPASINKEIISGLESFNRNFLDKKKVLVKNYGVTLGQSEVLKFLGAEGQKTVPQIARRLGVSRQNVQVIANKLKSASLVLTHPNPDHQLSPFISLTEKGEQISKALSDQEIELFDQILGGINMGEKTLFLRVLKSGK